MKFEFVEFYPTPDDIKQKNDNALGTVHIYAIDCELDIRGIRLTRRNKSIFFVLPHTITTDEEGQKVKYPFLQFTNEKTHKELMDFLHQEVKPKVEAILRTKAN